MTHASTDSFELGDYLGLLRRRLWIVVACACAGLLLGAAYTVLSPKTYTATASVFVNANAANTAQSIGGRTTGAVSMDNEAQIVQSDVVAQLAARQMHSTASLPDLIKQISVAVPPNTTVLQISCSAHGPKKAAACAQDFANSYLVARQGTAQAKIKANIQQEETRAAPLETKLVALQNKINSLPSDARQLAALRAQLENIASQLAPLRSSIATLGASTNYNAGYIITNAVPPGSPSSPRKLLYLPSGLLVGLLVGLVAAFAVDRRDDRIHAVRDLPRFLDLPVLFSTDDKAPLHVSLVPRRSKAGRAFTELAQTLATSLGDGNHVILVTGAPAGPGVSIVAANLAATLARIRGDTILVCADLDYSLSPQVLGVTNGRGLAEVMAGHATVDEVAWQSAEVPRLRVITPGVDTATALRQVQYESSRKMVSAMRGEFRYTVVEVAGTADGTDTLSLAEFADAALIVVELGRTTRSEVAACMRRLDQLRTEVFGAAVLPALGRAAWAAPQPAALAEEPQDPRGCPAGAIADGPGPPALAGGPAAADAEIATIGTYE